MAVNTLFVSSTQLPYTSPIADLRNDHEVCINPPPQAQESQVQSQIMLDDGRGSVERPAQRANSRSILEAGVNYRGAEVSLPSL